MKKLAIGNHLTPYLLVACGLLLGVLALESQNLVQSQDVTTAEAQSAVNANQRVIFTAPAIAAFSEITERPLFMDDRQPPPEPKKTARAAVISPLRLQLVGVAITPESRIALVRDLSSNKMLHLAAGMKHQNWELVSVTKTVATFKRGEQSQELTLKTKRK